MANESEDFLIASPKRMKLDIEESESDSNVESISFSTEYTKCDEENLLRGGEITPPTSSECDGKKDSRVGSEADGSEGDDNDDASSTVSNLSEISALSEMSGQHWKPISSSFTWLEKQMLKGVSPRIVLSQITGENTDLPESISDLALWRVIFNYLSEPPKRNPLPEVHSLDHAVELIRNSTKIMVLTGAGVSVSCGIPDFRSKDGVYARLAVDFPNLPDPQAMFDIQFFRQDPRPFFKFAKEIYPGLFQPSPSHRFIKAIERHRKLLRNYTQNIDTLERVAGIENVIECHGSFATATCTICGHKVKADEIKETVFAQNIPYCTKCSVTAENESEKGIMKPDIVFFGEGLPDTFHDAMAADKDQCDLLIVIGSSLKVRPVALIPSSLPPKVPQILINRERLPYMNFDIELLGDSDVVIDHLCRKLGEDWEEVCWRKEPLQDCVQSDMQAYCSDSSDSGSSEDEEETGVDRGPTEEEEAELGSRSGGVGSVLKCQKIRKRQGRPAGVGLPPGAAVGSVLATPATGGGGPPYRSSDEATRTVSLDSSRDSGIGENSNNSSDRCPSPPVSTLSSSDQHSPLPTSSSRSTRKPTLNIPLDKDNSIFCLQKRRYVFPGAEVPELASSSSGEDF